MIDENLPQNDPNFNEPDLAAYCDMCEREHENNSWCQAPLEY